MNQITEQQVRTARDDARDPWLLGNSVLYDLCSRHPHHRESQEIIAKVWLIGRSYSAAVERGRIVDPTDRSGLTGFYEQIASILVRSGIDAELARVRDTQGFSGEGTIELLTAHASLIELLGKLVNRQKRSFASKYLHFHLPFAFPIFDSIADTNLRKFIPGRLPSLEPSLRQVGDPEYRRFVLRLAEFRASIESRFGLRLTPRQLDRLLWRKGARPHKVKGRSYPRRQVT